MITSFPIFQSEEHILKIKAIIVFPPSSLIRIQVIHSIT